ncbi:nitroreductase family protein [Roseivirga misakiensis]|uniref:Nitroreductase n=1 Tax=Roseivirga misakiensis TaxID=1563681 RepID=A0A1E5T144_9BACT|nr:nitroreductase family protein [Roseivirga misakiensis]OEK05102.1 nitroreductase [Roseivirga misakiensis]
MEKKEGIKIIEGFEHVKYSHVQYSHEEMTERSQKFYDWMETRRSVREFSDKPVPKEVIENILLSASTAPSGAHKQPWTFCVVTNPEIKKKIREAAEKEEYESYTKRMSQEWLDDLKPMATDWEKPFLEIAPYLVIVFKRPFEYEPDGKKRQNYYVNESVGLAAGMLITAIHNAGLVTLTHTPSPMNFLQKILKRPDNERAFLLLPIGYEADEVYVPNNRRKSLEEMAVFYD